MSKIATSKVTVSLVIPVFNHERTIVNQLRKCEKILKTITNKFEIIAADDKSTDRSALLLKKYFNENKNFVLIFNQKNLGIAQNLIELYSLAKYKYICLYSADGDWNPNDIKRLILHTSRNKLDIVIGKRNKESYSNYRKIITFFYNFLPKIIFGVDAIDAGSIKVFDRLLYNSIPIVSNSVFFETEFIIRALKMNKRFGYIPISFKRHKITKGFGGRFSYVMSSLRDLVLLRFRI